MPVSDKSRPLSIASRFAGRDALWTARKQADQNNPDAMNNQPKPVDAEIRSLALQLRLDIGLLLQEIKWALGEERINRVTPPYDQFRKWSRERDGLNSFWHFANTQIGSQLSPDEVHDMWTCIELTLDSRRRRSFSFQDYLMIAMVSDQQCEYCRRRPPEVTLEIDHIVPVSKGGSESALNLRFLCQFHNRSRGNRFHWADVWRRMS